jgi:hypothetical protein
MHALKHVQAGLESAREAPGSVEEQRIELVVLPFGTISEPSRPMVALVDRFGTARQPQDVPSVVSTSTPLQVPVIA